MEGVRPRSSFDTFQRQVKVDLTPGERAALENLAHKADGEDVGWINIADARALEEKGLCIRDRQGWRISAEGARLAGEHPSQPEAHDTQPIPIRR